jgi:hypothetical protein
VAIHASNHLARQQQVQGLKMLHAVLVCWRMVQMYLKDNPIPLNGNWDEVSGEMFLRKMLSMQPEVRCKQQDCCPQAVQAHII